jgi:hypothetical protein
MGQIADTQFTRNHLNPIGAQIRFAKHTLTIYYTWNAKITQRQASESAMAQIEIPKQTLSHSQFGNTEIKRG